MTAAKPPAKTAPKAVAAVPEPEPEVEETEQPPYKVKVTLQQQHSAYFTEYSKWYDADRWASSGDDGVLIYKNNKLVAEHMSKVLAVELDFNPPSEEDI